MRIYSCNSIAALSSQRNLQWSGRCPRPSHLRTRQQFSAFVKAISRANRIKFLFNFLPLFLLDESEKGIAQKTSKLIAAFNLILLLCDFYVRRYVIEGPKARHSEKARWGCHNTSYFVPFFCSLWKFAEIDFGFCSTKRAKQFRRKSQKLPVYHRNLPSLLLCAASFLLRRVSATFSSRYFNMWFICDGKSVPTWLASAAKRALKWFQIEFIHQWCPERAVLVK